MADPHRESPPKTARLPFDIWWAMGGALAATLALTTLRLLGLL